MYAYSVTQMSGSLIVFVLTAAMSAQAIIIRVSGLVVLSHAAFEDFNLFPHLSMYFRVPTSHRMFASVSPFVGQRDNR